MRDSINAFIRTTDADLITYYSKANEMIDESDVRKISQMLAVYKSPERKKLNIMLHTQGGNINAAIALVEEFRELYPESIKSIVITEAKSSGAFVALCSDQCFMHTGSVLSDFTLDTGISNIDYKAAQAKSTALAFRGLLQHVSNSWWLQRFVLSTSPHGTDIPKEELIESAGVKKLSNYGQRTKPLAHIHNTIIDEFIANPNTRKVFGFNDNLYRV